MFMIKNKAELRMSSDMLQVTLQYSVEQQLYTATLAPGPIN